LETLCSICHNGIDRLIIRRVAGQGNFYSIFFCELCNIGKTFPQPSHDELKRLYGAGMYRSDEGKRFNFLIEELVSKFRSKRKSRIKKYKSNGAILDVGCGRGTFLEIMRRDGWKVMGTEFDPVVASTISTLYNFPVLHGDLNNLNLPEASFDVILLTHVLEHVRSPVETIRECYRLLKKEGLLVVSVPNIHSLQAMAGKAKWFHLDLPYHLHHFSEKGLLNLIELNSFSVERIKRFDLEYNPFGWLQTLLNLSGIRENALYSILQKTSDRRQISGKRTALFFSILLMPVYVPLSLLLSAFESAIKKAGTLEFYATKK
jgi:2-polyprenyl-3-methyl-5-hydroxy-6-metoxy-1,4-benzoquinol methylase